MNYPKYHCMLFSGVDVNSRSTYSLYVQIPMTITSPGTIGYNEVRKRVLRVDGTHFQ